MMRLSFKVLKVWYLVAHYAVCFCGVASDAAARTDGQQLVISQDALAVQALQCVKPVGCFSPCNIRM